MTEPKRKPKFKVGQVIHSEVLGYVRVRRARPNADSYHSHCEDKSGNHYFVTNGKGGESCASDTDVAKQTHLRPLTKREAGR